MIKKPTIKEAVKTIIAWADESIHEWIQDDSFSHLDQEKLSAAVYKELEGEGKTAAKQKGRKGAEIMRVKYFTVTKRKQGQRKNDFSHAKEGEICIIGSQCSRESVDGVCGCRRAMSGLPSAMATTTMTISLVDSADVIKTIADHYVKGWRMPADEAGREARRQFASLAEAAAAFPVGAVVERRGNRITERTKREAVL
jgi:hypothetical protein